MALNLEVGTAYTYTKQQIWTALALSGTYSAMYWKINAAGSNLPPGMTATITELSGTPTTPGAAYEVQLDKVDDYGDQEAVHKLSIIVASSEPEPPVPGAGLAASVARYLGKPDHAKTVALATEHVGVVTAFVQAYTRDRGFIAGEPNAGLTAVIVSATARLVSNPEQAVRYQVADVSETPAVFNGFTIPELAVLHRYRKRAI